MAIICGPILGFRGQTDAEFSAWIRSILAGVIANHVRRYIRTKSRDARLERELTVELGGMSDVLERGILGLRHGFPTRECTDQVHQRVDPFPFGDHSGGHVTRRGGASQFGGQPNEVGVRKVRVPDFPGNTGYPGSCLQKRAGIQADDGRAVEAQTLVTVDFKLPQ